MAAHAASNTLHLGFGYNFYSPPGGDRFAGDTGSFTFAALPAFNLSSIGLATATTSFTEEKFPDITRGGGHSMAFELNTTANYGSAGIQSAGVDNFMTLHLKRDLIPSVGFVLWTDVRPGEFVSTAFAVKVDGPGGFQHVAGCLPDIPDLPCTPFGFDDVSTGSSFGVFYLPPIDGDYVFSLSDFRLQAISDIPEPTTWALMLLGFGAVGVLIRSRAVRTRASAQAEMA